MDRIPPEVLNKIFIKLDLQQRLVCLLVCRQWWDVLDNCSLFYDVEIKKENDRFLEIMDTFERLPDRAAQVQEFYMVLKAATFFNKRKIVNIFPNARVIRVGLDRLTRFSTVTNHSQPIDSSPSLSTVESLSDVQHCDLFSQMLYSKLLGRLKELDLNFYGAAEDPLIFSQLKDLPFLKKLGLIGLNIKIDSLEELHENIPSIQNLNLKYSRMASGIMPSEIVPAISITSFNLYHIDSFNVNAHIQLYQYITKKYINLTQNDYEDSKLKKYDANDRKKIYLNGVLGFLKLIGPIRKKLALFSLPDGVDPFETLDSVDARIKTLEFNACDSNKAFDYLRQSKQYNYIETLNMTDTMPAYMYLLKDMPVLTSIKVSVNIADFPSISLVDCLAGCPPSLKSLSIEAMDLKSEPFTAKLESVENLKIGCEKVTGDLGDIITNCFPNLVELNLRYELTENVHITLKSPRFQKASISTSNCRIFNDFDNGFSFNSPNQTETQYYTGNSDSDLFEAKEKRHVQYEEIAHLPILSVESLNDAKLEMQGLAIVISC